MSDRTTIDMMEVPLHTDLIFALALIGSIALFHLAARSSTMLWLMIGWAVLQSALGITGVYQDTEIVPPRLLLFGVFPTLVMMAITFLTPKGKAFIDRIDLRMLTQFHVVRVPVEIVLALLFHQGLVSVLMTYEGTNFDLFSGITAPIAAWIGFRSGKVNRNFLLGWNILCLLLLLNVVLTAVFSIPSPFQKFAFDQPNVAVLHFPFNLLPALIVPLVLYAHLIALRRLMVMGRSVDTGVGARGRVSRGVEA